MTRNYQSWSKNPPCKASQVKIDDWRFENLPVAGKLPLTPFGNGRSYGDVCLNQDGVLLDTARLNRMIDFNRQEGRLTVEAGVQLGEILDLLVPAGWFLPVIPGTRFVTIGGAIANDIHGKNHHLKGSFGVHVERFELLQSSGERLICSRQQNPDLFAATIGGLGMTGLIIWAEINLIPVNSSSIEFEEIPYHSLAEFHEINQQSLDWEYTVAWIDCLSHTKDGVRGIYSRGRHANDSEPLDTPAEWLQAPLTPPISLINNLSLRCFNECYFRLHSRQHGIQRSHYRSFFFPLDGVKHWNRIYGRKGFYQYQCVVPDIETIEKLLALISSSGTGSFLAVLKGFGNIASPGLLSFPRPGFTLALDFPNQGERTLAFLDKLDNVVMAATGAVYPAKDARMSARMFQQNYPGVKNFSQHVDPQFSSSFWRRVNP
jgi:FAD/FMN-containing dehydrogenase